MVPVTVPGTCSRLLLNTEIGFIEGRDYSTGIYFMMWPQLRSTVCSHLDTNIHTLYMQEQTEVHTVRPKDRLLDAMRISSI